MKNPYWENIEQIAASQREKGIRNYGQGLEDNTDLTLEETITYVQEELIDALMYFEHLKVKLKEGKNNE